MKFYIAARTSQIAEVQRIISILEERNQSIIFDWTRIKNVDRPYKDNEKLTNKIAHQEIDAIKEADIFILLSDTAGTGMYVEMGVAIASSTKIYVIGEHNEATIFHFHSNVVRKDSFDCVLEDLGL